MNAPAGPQIRSPRLPLAAKVRRLDGVDPRSLVAKAEAAVAELKKSYPEEASEDVNRLAAAFAAASAKPGDNAVEVKRIHDIVFDMKSIAGTFDFMLVTQIGELLCRMTRAIEIADPPMLTVIGLHIDAIVRVFRDQIIGPGGEREQEVVTGLGLAAAKVTGQS